MPLLPWSPVGHVAMMNGGYDSFGWAVRFCVMVIAVRESLTSVESGAFTIDDLDNMPDDGRRRELIDGSVTLSPAPSGRHQVVLAELLFQLRRVLPNDMTVVAAPYDWVISASTVMQPDLMVVRRVALLQRLVEAPLLVAEVRSPSTARTDATLKRQIYADAGVPSYWLVDPDEPAIEVLSLGEAGYDVVAVAKGDDVLEVATPFAVSFRVGDLVRE